MSVMPTSKRHSFKGSWLSFSCSYFDTVQKYFCIFIVSCLCLVSFWDELELCVNECTDLIYTEHNVIFSFSLCCLHVTFCLWELCIINTLFVCVAMVNCQPGLYLQDESFYEWILYCTIESKYSKCFVVQLITWFLVLCTEAYI